MVPTSLDGDGWLHIERVSIGKCDWPLHHITVQSQCQKGQTPIGRWCLIAEQLVANKPTLMSPQHTEE